MMKQLTVMVALLAAVMIAVPAGAAPLLQDGLVSVWSFDEASGATTAVDTGGINTNDAVFSAGMATTGSDFTTSGVLGNYLQFNGGTTTSESAAVVPVDSSMFITGNQMSFATWVKLDVDPNDQYTSYVGIFDSLADNYAMYCQKSTGEIRMKIVNQAGQAVRIAAPPETIDPIVGSWAHVAVVYDGSPETMTTKMYVNGSEVASLWGLAGSLKTGQESSFGGQTDPNTGAVSGTLAGGVDEAGLWNRALTPDEISYLYNSGSGNAIMAANPEIGGSLGTLPFTTVDSAAPLIRYRFEGGLTNSGSLGASANGTLQDGTEGTTTYETPSGATNYLKLSNGDLASSADGDRIVIPFELASLDNGTISFALREDDNYDYNAVYNCAADGNDWEMWIYGNDAGSNKFRARIDSNGVQTNPSLDPNGNGVDEWNHYTITWSRDDADPGFAYMCMYLNGELVSGSTSTWNASGAEFYLGGGSGNDFGTWSMDEFRLYDVALSDVGAAQLYQDAMAAMVPEPSSVILLISALAGLGLFLRRR